MCSSPKLKQVKQTKSYPKSMALDMDQASYSRMIQQANEAYEKCHPESVDQTLITPKIKRVNESLSSKPLSYWLTQANMRELRHMLSNYISIN